MVAGIIWEKESFVDLKTSFLSPYLPDKLLKCECVLKVEKYKKNNKWLKLIKLQNISLIPRENGMWFWQTILSENFHSTPFPFFSPFLPTSLSVTQKKQVLLQLYFNKIFNFRQFQMELIGWIVAPDCVLCVQMYQIDIQLLGTYYFLMSKIFGYSPFRGNGP